MGSLRSIFSKPCNKDQMGVHRKEVNEAVRYLETGLRAALTGLSLDEKKFVVRRVGALCSERLTKLLERELERN